MTPTQTQPRTVTTQRPYDERRRRKTPLGWVPVAALVGLLLLGLLMWLVSRGGDDTSSGSGTTTSSVSGNGRLTVGGDSLLGRLGTDLSARDGEPVVANGVRVVAVVGDEAFWIGSGPDDRVLVHLRRSSESPFQVRAGQRVNLSGRLVRADSGTAGRFGVTDAEGAGLLGRQRAYVDATNVRLS